MTRRRQTRTSAEERLLRTMLLLFPKGFRDEYGNGMLEIMVTRLERAREAGGLVNRTRFWLGTLRDIVPTALVERLEESGLRRPRSLIKPNAPNVASKNTQFQTGPNVLFGKRGSTVESIVQDVRQAIRRLIKSPGFTATTILVVALGIGANAAIFSVVDSLLFRPLPWAQPEELVWIYQDSDDGDQNSNSYPAFLDIAAHEDVFSGVTAMINGRTARLLTDAGENLQVTVTYATSGYLPVLGLSPSIGRWFDESHDVPGGASLGVLSYRAWQRLYGGSPDVLGRSVRLNGSTATVIGVGPEGYAGAIPGIDNDLWLSLSSAGPVGGDFYWRTLERREDHWFLSIARLKPGVSPEQAQAAMNVLAERLATDYAALNAGRDITVYPANRVRQHPEGDAILFSVGALLMGVVGLVLLIACGNLANLLLARASTRGREVAIRLAVGATRRRLVRYLLAESVILSVAGGVLGLIVAAICGRLLAAYQLPIPLPMTFEIGVDLRVLVFALGLSVLTGIVFGLAPAIRASRPDLIPSLKDPSETFNVGQAQRRGLRLLGLRNLLVMLQVAVSIMLLVGAGLLVRSLVNAQNVDLGYSPESLAVLQADVREAGYESGEGWQVFSELSDRVEGLPGVEAVGLTSRLPTTESGGSSTLEVEGYQPANGTGSVEVIYAYATPNLFRALGIPVLFGRGFDDADQTSTERVALVNETFARRFYGAADAVGRRYRHQGNPNSWVQIVGVVRDFKVRSPSETPTPMFFRPLTQSQGWSRLYVVARTAGDAAGAVGMMRQELRSIDADVPVYQAGTMTDHISHALAIPRAAASMLAVFGALALMLASLGLYAVVAFVVSQRSTEMGIRVALGASGSRVFAMVVREMMTVVGIGAIVGLGLSFVSAPVLESQLFNVGPTDPTTLALVVGLLLLVAFVATCLPALRAARADPMSAMRTE